MCKKNLHSFYTWVSEFLFTHSTTDKRSDNSNNRIVMIVGKHTIYYYESTVIINFKIRYDTWVSSTKYTDNHDDDYDQRRIDEQHANFLFLLPQGRISNDGDDQKKNCKTRFLFGGTS